MRHIGNSRYVVQGRREADGRVWAIHATDSLAEAERVLHDGMTIDGFRWNGVKLHDRREAIMPRHGWSDVDG
jgi:hypothetical protein